MEGVLMSIDEKSGQSRLLRLMSQLISTSPFTTEQLNELLYHGSGVSTAAERVARTEFHPKELEFFRRLANVVATKQPPGERPDSLPHHADSEVSKYRDLLEDDSDLIDPAGVGVHKSKIRPSDYITDPDRAGSDDML